LPTSPATDQRTTHTRDQSNDEGQQRRTGKGLNDERDRQLPLRWSIKSRALQFIVPGEPLNQNPIKLSPSTGLIGSPQSSIDSTVSLGNPQQFDPRRILKNTKQPKPKDPSIIKFRSLLTPGLIRGRLVQLKSDDYDGSYMLMELENAFDERVSEVETMARAFDDLMYHSNAHDLGRDGMHVVNLSSIFVRHVQKMTEAREAIYKYRELQRERIRVAAEEAVKADRLIAARRVVRKRKVRR
jgi:hypothetical protein